MIDKNKGWCVFCKTPIYQVVSQQMAMPWLSKPVGVGCLLAMPLWFMPAWATHSTPAVDSWAAQQNASPNTQYSQKANAQDDISKDKPSKDKPAIAPQIQIEQITRKLERLQQQSGTSSTDLSLGAFDGVGDVLSDEVGVARIDAQVPALGIEQLQVNGVDKGALDKGGVDKNTAKPQTQNSDQTLAQASPEQQTLDPDVLLPAYQKSNTLSPQSPANDVISKQPSLINRLMNRFLKDGVAAAPRLSARVYLLDNSLLDNSLPDNSLPDNSDVGSTDTTNQQAGDQQTDNQTQTQHTSTADNEVLVPIERTWSEPNQLNSSVIAQTTARRAAPAKDEPFANIIAAIENITVEQTPSFSVALPRLRQVVESAARAVGYYDMDFTLAHAGNGEIEVLVRRLGEPVRISEQIVDIRGQGATDSAFITLKNQADQRIGEVLNHGDYEATKAGIDAVQVAQGFFDGRWLDNSVEVLLPDNQADVSLVYETGERYRFDEVVFFTTDPATGQLTTDPDKLPVKPSLLHQLINFEQGDFFDRQAVNQLSADLMTTRYFNTANVETVLPAHANPANQPKTPKPVATPDKATDIRLHDETEGEVQARTYPIDFSPSQDLIEKLGLVATKANRLYNSPDDRILDESTRKRSTSLLGRISDTVSNIVKAILPDDAPDETAMTQNPRAGLAGRKLPEQVAVDKKVPLYIFVSSERPNDMQAGLGWGSDTGLRATARLDNTLINRAGYQAGVDMSFSQIDKGINAYASRPLSHPINDKLGINARYYEERIAQPNAAALSSQTLESGVVRNIINPEGYNRSYSLRYRLDKLKTNQAQGDWRDLPQHFYAGEPSQQAVLFGASLSKTTQNQPIAPTQGHRQHYSLEMGSRKLGSDTDLVIAKANFGAMRGFGDNAYGKERAHQLVGRFEAGYLWAKDFERVPYKLRFFAGGDQSIRGYNYQSIAPVNEAGYLMGGQIMAVGGLEYNYEVKEGLRAAVFGDVGGAYDKKFAGATKIGAGVGVRWASPVGTVRVDIAKGIEKSSTPIRLHFMIGLPF